MKRAATRERKPPNAISRDCRGSRCARATPNRVVISDLGMVRTKAKIEMNPSEPGGRSLRPKPTRM